MKRHIYLLIIVIVFGLSQIIKASNPALVTWPLATSSSSINAATTSGQVSGADEILSGLTYGSAAYTAIGTTYMQRMQITGGTWPANETARTNTRYVQFSVSPKIGNVFNVDSIGMFIAAKSSSTLKTDILYSTDPTFSTNVNQFTYTTGLTSGTATNVLSSTAAIHIKISSIGISLNPGQSLYIRVFPWNETTATATGKYLCLENLNVGGSTESLPVSSSIIWPCTTDLISAVTTGTIMSGGTTSLSGLIDYGNLSYSGTSLRSIYTGTVWPAETAPAENRYVQFAAAPKSGGTLVLDSLTLSMGAWTTNDFRVSVFCSKDPNFTLLTGISLAQDIAVASGIINKSVIPASLTVNSGEVVYVRLYPYSLSTTGDQWKLIGLNNVSIFGKVTGVTADPPTISTTSVSSISTTFATTGGNVSSDGGAAVTDRGIVYSVTNISPTISDSKIQTGTGSGIFTTQLTGLTPGTLYYIRSYATNSAGTSYGSILSFTSMATLTVPVLTTATISSILAITATSGGNVTDWGGSAVTSRGICWSTSTSPTISNSIVTIGNGIGTFTGSLFSLSPTTVYYVRAFATNTTGTGYGNEVSFTTQAVAADMIKVVNKDGSGDYTTIQAAFNDVPDNYTGRWIINVKPGTYTEKCTLASTKSNVFLIGEDAATTIITYNAYAAQSNGAGGTWGTSGSFSVAIDANDFLAKNITFQNTQKNDGSTGTSGEQAVALRVRGDRQQYYNCRLLGYQDTYYTYSNGRIYMKNCYIEGSVDFIFGNGIMVMDSCQTYVNRDGGVVCAPNTDLASLYGYVFRNCTLNSLPAGTLGFNNVAMSSFYLGRPWQNNPKAVYITCIESATLNAAGWTTMTAALNPYFAEYKCTGPGSGIASRSTNVDYLGRQLTDTEAANYTLNTVFAKTSNPVFSYDWLPSVYVAPTSGTTGISQQLSDTNLRLYQNYPNPVVNSAIISYLIPNSGRVIIDLYNITGEKVANLTNKIQSSGNHQLIIDATELKKGMYFYTMKANGSVLTCKMHVK